MNKVANINRVTSGTCFCGKQLSFIHVILMVQSQLHFESIEGYDTVMLGIDV